MEIPFGPNDNVLVELGFMLGKGAEPQDFLVLYDRFTMPAQIQGEIKPPGGTNLPTVIRGNIYREFRSNEPNLTTLRQKVSQWAKAIVLRQAAVKADQI